MYKFERLTVWQKSVELIKISYDICKQLPILENKGLSDQLRRASTSIALNIAEGSGSNTDKEFCRFLYLSRKSLFEVVAITKIISLLYPATETKQLNTQIEEVGRLLSGLINKLKSNG